MYVSDILKAKGDKVETVAPGMTVLDVAALLAKKRIGAVLVLDKGGAVCGILSERDIVGGIGGEGASALERTVGDLMTGKVVTCKPDDDLKHLMSVMTERRIRHLPVMDAGRLAGIVSIGDVVKHRIDEVEREVGAMQDYVRGA